MVRLNNSFKPRPLRGAAQAQDVSSPARMLCLTREDLTSSLTGKSCQELL